MDETHFELTLTTHPLGGQAQAVRARAAELEQQPGRWLALWATEYGPLNRLLTLCERPKDIPLRIVPEPSLDWLDNGRVHYPLLERRALRHDLVSSPLLELRMYAAKPGRCEEFIDLMLRALPFRERYSPCVGVWSTQERGWDVVAHLWAYDGLSKRIQARLGAATDSDWARYRLAIPPLLEHMQAFALTPLPRPA